jgi:peptidoglycan/LPS O-acetylase OafA/YrhL
MHPDVLVSSHPASSVLAFNLFWLGVIDVVIEGSGRGTMSLLRLGPLTCLGQISYGLYLYHFPALAILLDIARGLGFTGKVYMLKVGSILLSVLIARLSWRFIERPFLALKRRFPYTFEGGAPMNFPREQGKATDRFSNGVTGATLTI